MIKCYKCKDEHKVLYSASGTKLSPMQSVAWCPKCFKEETKKSLGEESR